MEINAEAVKEHDSVVTTTKKRKKTNRGILMGVK